jgi:ribonuclease BN (tRNA processing enzyme)
VSTELVVLGTAGGPIPVKGRAGTSSALLVDDEVYVVDCGRGAPTRFTESDLDFAALRAIFLTHLHIDHTGDLPGMMLYPWGSRVVDGHPVEPLQVYGPGSPGSLPDGEPPFQRRSTMFPEHPASGTRALVNGVLAAYSFHLNVFPLDGAVPDAGQLVRAHDILGDRTFDAGDGDGVEPEPILETGTLTVSATLVAHGYAHPAIAYRFDTTHGSVVFAGDTRPHPNLVKLAAGADVLVHEVVDLAFLQAHGTPAPGLAAMKRLHTDVNGIGEVAEAAGVKRVVLNHYLPAAPAAVPEADWVARASAGFSGDVVAGADGLRMMLR